MNVYLLAFLTIPIIAIFGHQALKFKYSLWWIFAFFMPIGWALFVLSHISYQSSLDELVRSTANPSDELLNEWQNDGAANVFALYFGWLISIVYFFVCFVVVKAGMDVINRIQNAHES